MTMNKTITVIVTLEHVSLKTFICRTSSMKSEDVIKETIKLLKIDKHKIRDIDFASNVRRDYSNYNARKNTVEIMGRNYKVRLMPLALGAYVIKNERKQYLENWFSHMNLCF